jgi:hypothetical protein
MFLVGLVERSWGQSLQSGLKTDVFVADIQGFSGSAMQVDANDFVTVGIGNV